MWLRAPEEPALSCRIDIHVELRGPLGIEFNRMSSVRTTHHRTALEDLDVKDTEMVARRARVNRLRTSAWRPDWQADPHRGRQAAQHPSYVPGCLRAGQPASGGPCRPLSLEREEPLPSGAGGSLFEGRNGAVNDVVGFVHTAKSIGPHFSRAFIIGKPYFENFDYSFELISQFFKGGNAAQV